MKRIIIAFVLILLFFPSMKAQEKKEVALVTGFEPFANYDINPSEIVAMQLNGSYIGNVFVLGIVLPVDYERAEEILHNLIRKYEPSIILCTGLEYNARKINVERIAINLKSIYVDGKWKGIEVINRSALFILFSNIPVDRIVNEIKSEGIKARQSLFAGTYLCNYVFFIMLNHVLHSNEDIKVGFIHFPPLKQQAKYGMDIEKMVRAVEIAIECSSV